MQAYFFWREREHRDIQSMIHDKIKTNILVTQTEIITINDQKERKKEKKIKIFNKANTISFCAHVWVFLLQSLEQM